MNIDTTQQQIIDEFSDRAEWFDKYEHLITLGRELNVQTEDFKTQENSISGCQSEVWLSATMQDGRVRILADSDALITKGIISLLLRVLDGRTPGAIVEADLYFVEEIGLESHLSPARSNGLAAIIQNIRSRAEAFLSSSEP